MNTDEINNPEQENTEEKTTMDNTINTDESIQRKVIENQSVDEYDLHKVIHVQSMFDNWFLDYASSVILDRAVPDVIDGLKPVQRRILHSMDELEDGRFNKVANIIGNTMKYHPHGDASIGDALVNLGQKMLTVETQGNWGNILTGDSAAAPRYIEARLSKFALEVVYYPKITEWKLSYDGRNREPVTLPIKFPLLLAQGTLGIGVALKTFILPHNFIELIDGSIAILENRDFELYPDFFQGGTIDVSKYNEGLQGGKIRNRAKISIIDNKTLSITEIPFGTNTGALINDSITPAINNGKLKIKKIDDNTAATVEILLHLQPGVSPDLTIDALYAFTDCEMTYSPNACVLYKGRPHFMSVKEILRINTENTRNLLQKQLEVELNDLEDEWHKWSLEKIFFEKRIYKQLEEETETWEEQISLIEKAFDPYRTLFRKEITKDDVLRLCEKPVKKISKFDIKKADDQIAKIEEGIAQILEYLSNITQYTIQYFKDLKKKYGKGRERKTEIKNFENIVAAAVAINNLKLYVNKSEGFVGTGLKKDENTEFVCECSDLDEIIVFRGDGKFSVRKVSDKQFFGKGIIEVGVFKRNDDRTIYNAIYSDGNNGTAMIKRFSIGGITRDKEYDITKGKTGSKVLYLSTNPNGEAEKVKVFLKIKPKLKKTKFDFDFSTIMIKGRGAAGNILSRHAINRVELSEKGISTLSAINIYLDKSIMRLNSDQRGDLLGSFMENDKIIAIYKSGYYKISGYELTTHFDDDPVIIEKYSPKKIITVIYRIKKEEKYFIKRFIPDAVGKKVDFLPDDKSLQLMNFSYDTFPMLKIQYTKKKDGEKLDEIINCSEFVDISTVKSKGKRIALNNIFKISILEPLPEPILEEECPEDDLDIVDDDDFSNGEDENQDNLDMIIAKEIFNSVRKNEDNNKSDDDNPEKDTVKEDSEIVPSQGEELTIFEMDDEDLKTEPDPTAKKKPADKRPPKKKKNDDDDEWEQLTLF